jgi:ribosome-binding factor A
MSKQRTKRISEEIKKIVSHLIMFNMKDPRVSKMTSIVHVDTTNDLSFTNIYISVYDPKADPQKTLEGLNSAKGFIRKEIGKELKLRITPEPVFVLDKSIENGMYINQLLKDVGADQLLEAEKKEMLKNLDGDDDFDEEEEDDLDDDVYDDEDDDLEEDEDEDEEE